MNRQAGSTRQAAQQELFARKPVKAGQVEIPDKLYFKIGEVSAITGVEPHVLRYWEAEIGAIKPQRASSKQRLYRRVDIENILTIKKLIHEDGYTISGAKKFMAARKKKGPEDTDSTVAPAKKQAASLQEICREMKSQLREIKELLKQ